MEENKKEMGKRFNQGKIRFDLINPYALEQVAKIMTMGAEKYGEGNWEKGLKFSTIEASLRRHLNAYSQCEDFDEESKIYHSAHIASNALMLTAMYRLHPELDDRRKPYLTQPKITLDIDEVVCQWQKGYSARFGCPVDPRYWNQSYAIADNLSLLKGEEDFWTQLEAHHHPDFEPHAYVSSRSIPVEWSQKFIVNSGLPCAPIYHVPFGASKIEILKEIGSEIHIDDSFKNFKECEENGITAFLMDAPHNQHYKVGYKRLYDLQIKNIVR